MSIPRDYKKLFQPPAAADKLTLLHLLYEGSELNPDLALALLKVVHRELGRAPASDRSVYKRYAGAIQLLRHHQPEMLQQIVDTWKAKSSAAPAEWFVHTNAVG